MHETLTVLASEYAVYANGYARLGYSVLVDAHDFIILERWVK